MYDFKFADIGEGIHEGQILKWLYKEGDIIKEGETLVIIETDKVNAEIPSPVNGKIIKLGAKEGETINVGETLVLIDDGSKNTVDEKPNKEENAGVVGEIEVSSNIIASSQEIASETTTSAKALATPVARKLAADLGLDINQISGSGENGRVLKEDIYQANNKAETIFQDKPVAKSQSIHENITRVPITKLRKAIVNSMVQSKTMIPHTVLMEEINVSNLVEFRKSQKGLADNAGIKLTFMPFIVKAIALTIKSFPIFNASYDHENEEIVYKNYLNLGIAVDTVDGLIVPNIKNADQLSIIELAKEIELLAKQANERTLNLNQIQDGTFTITNYGSFETSFGTPIIKYPESAIMGIGRITKKPIVIENELAIGDILPISLAGDHRIIDGADAGRFIMKFKEYITNPMLLLLS